MKKIMNAPEKFVDEMLEGIVAAHGSEVRLLEEHSRVLLRREEKETGKVGIVTAGGSGHLPLFLGYVGEGMLDGCAVGNVFASPSASSMAEMIRACDRGAGVICLFGNYGGDRMNFAMACEEVEFDDIETRTVIAGDDVASSPKGSEEKRRGVAGIVYAYKIAGAAAERGYALDDVVSVTQRVLDYTRTIGFATSPCIIPEVGKPSFSIGENEIEVGMGIHGEPGVAVREMMSADEIAEYAVRTLLDDIEIQEGETISVMINGLGSTPLEEQYIVYRKLAELLGQRSISVKHPHLGEYATSMEMSGLSITFVKLDEELESLLSDVAKTPFYTNYNK
ncbi:MAG: dihydroxyacetone kinase subunit DhaK [Ndongobacter sp.]|nr:dihydroxyacetone kinase subunit DhaK [Ndongobacter sp.]